MQKINILQYLKSKKATLKTQYGITVLGLYGSYARDEATPQSDVDIFYERDSNIELESGLKFLSLANQIAQDLEVEKVDLVKLSRMNPIIRHYAEKDFIYV